MEEKEVEREREKKWERERGRNERQKQGSRRRGENGFERWEGRMDKHRDGILGRTISKRRV